MSGVPGRRGRDWSHVPRATAQPAESVQAVPKSPPKTQSGEMPTLTKGSIVPRAYCVTRPEEAESRTSLNRIVSQLNSVYSLTFCMVSLKIHFNNIFPFTSLSLKVFN